MFICALYDDVQLEVRMDSDSDDLTLLVSRSVYNVHWHSFWLPGGNYYHSRQLSRRKGLEKYAKIEAFRPVYYY